MSKIIDGKKISGEIKEELKEKVAKLKEKPTLVVISVGDNPASKVYVGQKEKCALYIGLNYKHMHYDSISDDELVKVIEKLNKDKKINGVIVQLPLPDGIVNTIIPEKDVDGLTYLNAGLLLNNETSLVSCTPKGIMELLKREKVNLVGANAVVIGRSILVGKPMMNLLINANATVTMCHSKTKDLAKITRKADVLVVAIGKKHFVTRDMVKKGAVVKITPVPGGVGPMTVVMLMKNVIESYEKQNS